jgi:hypothetical protein
VGSAYSCNHRSLGFTIDETERTGGANRRSDQGKNKPGGASQLVMCYRIFMSSRDEIVQVNPDVQSRCESVEATLIEKMRSSANRIDSGAIQLDEDLISLAQELTGIMDSSEALKMLIHQEASRRVARLGGTMPSLEDIPRR